MCFVTFALHGYVTTRHFLSPQSVIFLSPQFFLWSKYFCSKMCGNVCLIPFILLFYYWYWFLFWILLFNFFYFWNYFKNTCIYAFFQKIVMDSIWKLCHHYHSQYYKSKWIRYPWKQYSWELVQPTPVQLRCRYSNIYKYIFIITILFFYVSFIFIYFDYFYFHFYLFFIHYFQ